MSAVSIDGRMKMLTDRFHVSNGAKYSTRNKLLRMSQAQTKIRNHFVLVIYLQP